MTVLGLCRGCAFGPTGAEENRYENLAWTWQRRGTRERERERERAREVDKEIAHSRV